MRALYCSAVTGSPPGAGRYLRALVLIDGVTHLAPVRRIGKTDPALEQMLLAGIIFLAMPRRIPHYLASVLVLGVPGGGYLPHSLNGLVTIQGERVVRALR